MDIKWRRRKASDGRPQYEAEVRDGPMALTVAIAVQTGTHLDDYPWDWYLTDRGVARVKAGAKHGGSCDTLRSAKDAAWWALR